MADKIPPDPPFGPDEELYRRLKPDDIENGTVLGTSIDLPPACSFNRAAHSRPEDVLSADRPEYTGIAVAVVRTMEFRITSPNNVTFQTYVAHVPENGNYAHSEVRLTKAGRPYTKNIKVKPAEFRRSVREEIASRLRILRPPR